MPDPIDVPHGPLGMLSALLASRWTAYDRHMTADFPLYELSEEHGLLREAVRALADDKIAPHAAAADENAEFPQAAYDALVQADMHAVHIPETYDGVGA